VKQGSGNSLIKQIKVQSMREAVAAWRPARIDWPRNTTCLRRLIELRGSPGKVRLPPLIRLFHGVVHDTCHRFALRRMARCEAGCRLSPVIEEGGGQGDVVRRRPCQPATRRSQRIWRKGILTPWRRRRVAHLGACKPPNCVAFIPASSGTMRPMTLPTFQALPCKESATRRVPVAKFRLCNNARRWGLKFI
jgi:hypothetical protein